MDGERLGYSRDPMQLGKSERPASNLDRKTGPLTSAMGFLAFRERRPLIAIWLSFLSAAFLLVMSLGEAEEALSSVDGEWLEWLEISRDPMQLGKPERPRRLQSPSRCSSPPPFLPSGLATSRPRASTILPACVPLKPSHLSAQPKTSE